MRLGEDGRLREPQILLSRKEKQTVQSRHSLWFSSGISETILVGTALHKIRRVGSASEHFDLLDFQKLINLDQNLVCVLLALADTGLLCVDEFTDNRKYGNG